MPTEAKIARVAELKDKLDRCSIAVSTDYTGLKVNDMTDLRRRMRRAGVEFTVVKNHLMELACDGAQRPDAKEIVKGPTAIAFGYDDAADVAKALSEYIRTTRSVLNIRGAMLRDGPVLPAAEVTRLASLPPKAVLVATLLGQMQAPMQRLLGVLNGPVRGLAGLLQARIHQLESEEPGS